MRIGQIAEKTGVSRDTIRLYEDMELLVGITRPNEYNNYKDYPEENIERVQMIITMKKLGLTLKECKQVISTIEDDGFDKNFQYDFLHNKIKEIDTKIKELKNLKKILITYQNEGCDNEEIVNVVSRKKVKNKTYSNT
jgi:DNA-binding transcriptional MerR regulator